MFIIENNKLEELIKKSSVLNQKLDHNQMAIFIKKALSLPIEGQEELRRKLENEEAQLTQMNRQSVIDYGKKANEMLNHFKRETFIEAETMEQKKMALECEMLLKQLTQNYVS